jgi:hypothetical protein
LQYGLLPLAHAHPVVPEVLMRFIVVNNRSPRAATFCALCCEKIAETYLLAAEEATGENR